MTSLRFNDKWRIRHLSCAPAAVIHHHKVRTAFTLFRHCGESRNPLGVRRSMPCQGGAAMDCGFRRNDEG
ncbi:MAG: hypothetical protein Q4G70_08925 [Pseudomonadota bacterium]|nr:hypothetical protein [Pseudomonadota bacterium]